MSRFRTATRLALVERAIWHAPPEPPPPAPALPTTAVRIDWDEVEHEPDWGVTYRPDGHTLYRDLATAQADVADNEKGTQRSSGYSCNYAPGKPTVVTLSDDDGRAMAASPTGIVSHRK